MLTEVEKAGYYLQQVFGTELLCNFRYTCLLATTVKSLRYLTGDDLFLDFQSIELRLLSHLSEDPSLIQIFNNKQCSDVFTTLASQW